MCFCVQEDRIATAKENKLPSGENKLGVKLPQAAASPWVHGSSPSPAKVFDRASISISPSKFFTNNRWTLFFFSIYPGKPDQYLLGFQGQSQSMQQRTGRRTVCSSCSLPRAPVEQGYQAQWEYLQKSCVSHKEMQYIILFLIITLKHVHHWNI